MAYTRRYRSSGSGATGGLSQEDILKLVGRQVDTAPKAGLLERLLALPMAIGSAGDVAYQTKFRNKKALPTFLENITQGARTAFTGERDLTPLKGWSDVLKRGGTIRGTDPLSKATRGVLGFGLDVLTDPTTYISFGASSAAKAGAKEVAEGLAKEGGERALKVLGKEVTTNPALVGAVSMAANPLGETARLAGKGVQKFAPEVAEAASETAAKIFDPGKYYQKKGVGKLYESVKDFSRSMAGEERKTLTKLMPTLRRIQDLPPQQQAQFGDLVEGAMKAGQDEKLSKLLTEVRDITGDLGTELEERGLITRLGAQAPEQLAKSDSATAAMEAALAKSRKLGSEGAETLGAKIGATTTQRVGDPILDEVEKISASAKEFGEEGLAKLEGLFDEYKNKYGMLAAEGQIGMPIDLYKKELSDMATGNYFPRDVLGFNEQFIKDRFGDQAETILTDKRALKDLQTGFIRSNTLGEIINEGKFRTGVAGLKDPGKYLEGSNLQRVFDTVSEGKASGVIYNENAAEALAKGTLKGQKAVRAYDFASGLQDITDDAGNKMFYKAGELKEGIPAGFKQFEIQGVGKFAAPKEAHEVLKNYSKEFITDEGMNSLLKGYDKMLQTWKASVTGLGPGFLAYNVRNALGDFTNMALDGFKNFGNIKKGAQVLQFEELAAKEGMEAATKKFGKEIAELYDLALDNGVLTSQFGQIAEEVGTSRSGLELAEDLGLKTATKDTAGKAMDRWKQIATMGGLAPKREEAFRLAHFADTLERTGKVDEAAQAVRRAMFDYTDLSPTEKNVFKRVIPFYSWMRKNLEFQLTNFAQSPGKYTGMQRAIDNIRKEVGADITDEEWSAMPDWLKGGLAIPIKSKDGDVTVLTQFGLPTEALNQLTGGDKNIVQNILGMTSPMIKTPLELGTGKSFFTGRDIAEETYGGRYANLPEPLKELMGYRAEERTTKAGKEYTKETVDPYMAYLMANLPIVAPTMTTGKRVSEVGGDPLNILNLVSGGKVYTRNVEQEQRSREREDLQRLQEYLLRQGLGDQFTSFSLSPEAQEELLRMYNR